METLSHPSRPRLKSSFFRQWGKRLLEQPSKLEWLLPDSLGQKRFCALHRVRWRNQVAVMNLKRSEGRREAQSDLQGSVSETRRSGLSPAPGAAARRRYLGPSRAPPGSPARLMPGGEGTFRHGWTGAVWCVPLCQAVEQTPQAQGSLK